MLTGYGFYKIYAPIKLHFTTSYNATKYCKVPKSISKDNFQTRKDVQRFELLGGKTQTPKDALEFCIFNFVYQNENWFYDDLDTAKDIFLNKRAFFANLKQNLTLDLKTIESVMKDKNLSFSQLINKTKSGGLPPIFQMMTKNMVSKEFLCLLENDMFSNWEKEYENDPFVSKTVFGLTKYKPFVTIIKEGKVG